GKEIKIDYGAGSAIVTMKMIIVVGVGSCIGGIFRYLLSQSIQSKFLSTFPFGTLSVNIIGCFFIGLIFGFSERSYISIEWRLFLATGISGGFTTFSSFSYETVELIRDGQYWLALWYIASSVIIGLVATFLGISIFKLL
ncbi:MAG: fluoride efflux transporter CrcB, partial [Ginsengibacter sp.]